jgi:hypothetical protein
MATTLSPFSPSRRLALVLASLLALQTAGCGRPNEQSATSPTSDPGPVHVHGLGVNPRDGALFIATHTGLFRAAPGQQRASRVAGRYQDTMGFTVVGPDRFLGSGHPDLREELPPFLGLIRSQDAGKTWKPLSLLGKADFHVLEAQGNRIYGFGADFQSRREQLLVSRNGGQQWSRARLPEPLVSIAIDPRNADHVVASGHRHLYESRDAGRNWKPIPGEPGLAAWPAGDQLFLIRATGAVATSTRPGAAWKVVGQTGGEPAAFEADGGHDLYVALHSGIVRRSTDGGRTWTLRSRP